MTCNYTAEDKNVMRVSAQAEKQIAFTGTD